MAADADTRARRLATLSYVESTFEPVPIDADAARAWGRLVASLRQARRRVPVNDVWNAAIANARGIAVVTQDEEFDSIPGLHVIRV